MNTRKVKHVEEYTGTIHGSSWEKSLFFMVLIHGISVYEYCEKHSNITQVLNTHTSCHLFL